MEGLVTAQQLSLVASRVSAHKIHTFGRDLLGLTDIQIESSGGRVTVPLHEKVYAAVRKWEAKDEGNGAEQLRTLLKRATRDNAAGVAAYHCVNNIQHHGKLSNEELSELSKKFTPVQYEQLCRSYLKLDVADVDSSLPHPEQDLYRTAQGMLERWCSCNIDTACVRVLYRLVQRGEQAGIVEHGTALMMALEADGYECECFVKNCNVLGYRLHKPPFVGPNSLFESVSSQLDRLSMPPQAANELRKQVCDYMDHNTSIEIPTGEIDFCELVPNSNLGEYVTRMRQPTAPGDRVCVMVLAKILTRDILLLNSTTTSGAGSWTASDAIETIKGAMIISGYPILLGHISDGNYLSLEENIKFRASELDGPAMQHYMKGIAKRDGINNIPAKATPVLDVDDVTETIRQDLKEYYQEDCRLLCPIPWAHTADVQHHIKDMFVSLETVELQKKRKGRRQADIESKSVKMEELLTTTVIPTARIQSRHTLVEGTAGSGKTALCQKLAYDWATDTTQIKRLLEFTFVFFIKVYKLKDGDSLAQYICRELLSEDLGISLLTLEDTLRQTSIVRKTLYIVDGFDELTVDCTAVLKLIERKISRSASMLITSRPGATQSIVRHLDIGLQLGGFTHFDIQIFLKKYAKQTTIDGYEAMNARSHSLLPLLSNPLFLWFFAILGDGAFTDAEHFTRTEFFKNITSAILKKVGEHHNVSPESCVRALRSLITLAYDSLSQNKTSFEMDLKDIELKLGLVNKVVSRHGILETKVSYEYTHKSVQEFLAARHITDNKENDVCSMLRNVPDIQDVDKREGSVLLYLTCGLLTGRDEELVKVFQEFVPDVQIAENDDLSDISKHSVGHGALMCIAESGLFNGLNKLCSAKLPQNVQLDHFECIQSCARALKTLREDDDLQKEYRLKYLRLYAKSQMYCDEDVVPFVVQSADNNSIILYDNHQLPKLIGNEGFYHNRNIEYLGVVRCTEAVEDVKRFSPKRMGVFDCSIGATLQLVADSISGLEELCLAGVGFSSVAISVFIATLNKQPAMKTLILFDIVDNGFVEGSPHDILDFKALQNKNPNRSNSNISGSRLQYIDALLLHRLAGVVAEWLILRCDSLERVSLCYMRCSSEDWRHILSALEQVVPKGLELRALTFDDFEITDYMKPCQYTQELVIDAVKSHVACQLVKCFIRETHQLYMSNVQITRHHLTDILLNVKRSNNMVEIVLLNLKLEESTPEEQNVNRSSQDLPTTRSALCNNCPASVLCLLLRCCVVSEYLTLKNRTLSVDDLQYLATNASETAIPQIQMVACSIDASAQDDVYASRSCLHTPELLVSRCPPISLASLVTLYNPKLLQILIVRDVRFIWSQFVHLVATLKRYQLLNELQLTDVAVDTEDSDREVHATHKWPCTYMMFDGVTGLASAAVLANLNTETLQTLQLKDITLEAWDVELLLKLKFPHLNELTVWQVAVPEGVHISCETTASVFLHISECKTRELLGNALLFFLMISGTIDKLFLQVLHYDQQQSQHVTTLLAQRKLKKLHLDRVEFDGVLSSDDSQQIDATSLNFSDVGYQTISPMLTMASSKVHKFVMQGSTMSEEDTKDLVLQLSRCPILQELKVQGLKNRTTLFLQNMIMNLTHFQLTLLGAAYTSETDIEYIKEVLVKCNTLSTLHLNGGAADTGSFSRVHVHMLDVLLQHGYRLQCVGFMDMDITELPTMLRSLAPEDRARMEWSKVYVLESRTGCTVGQWAEEMERLLPKAEEVLH